jgi:glycosyltransferase involved in cell wall biosynthesis
MKIMSCLHSLEPGGIQYCLLDQIRAFNRLGLSSTVLCLGRPELREIFELAGARVISLDGNPFPKAVNREFVDVICRIIEREAPNVIDTNIVFCDWQVRAAAQRIGFKHVIVSQHGFGDGWDAKTCEIERQQSDVVKTYIAVSRWVKTKLIEYGIPEDKVKVIYNGVDLNIFTPTKPDTVHKDISNGLCKYDVGFVGRLEYSKGPEMLGKVLRQYLSIKRHARALVIGDGNGRKYLAHPRIDITGFVPHSSVPMLLNSCSTILLTSRSDSCPAAILEAGALGIPVVAHHVGGIPELVQHGKTGFLCSQEAQMVESLLQLNEDTQLRRDFGSRAAYWIRHNFDLCKQLKERLMLYNRLASKQSVAN